MVKRMRNNRIIKNTILEEKGEAQGTVNGCNKKKHGQQRPNGRGCIEQREHFYGMQTDKPIVSKIFL